MSYISTVDSLVANYQTSEKDRARFRFWHVEPLLNQAADLLDRCLKERAEYNALRAQWYTQDQSLAEAKVQRELDQDREGAGWPDVPYEVLSREIKATPQKTLGSDPIQGKSELYKHHEHIDQYLRELEEESPTAPKTYKNPLMIQRHQNWISKYSIAAETYAKERQAEWEDREKAFRRTAMKNSSAHIDEREALRSGGTVRDETIEESTAPLNYREQYSELEKLLVRDFQDAIDRMSVAATGMEKLYGYTAEDVATITVRQHPITGAVEWVREAIRWLAAFAQLDQAFTHVISVRAKVNNDEKWLDATNSKGPLVLEFPIAEEDFADHSHVRLRGLSGFVIGSEVGPSAWRGAVRLPEAAGITHWLEPDDTKSPLRKLDQKQLPPCRLGRIEARTVSRPPEVAGMVSLMNGSPISGPPPKGEDEGSNLWRVTLWEPARASPGLRSLEDIELELILVGRPILPKP